MEIVKSIGSLKLILIQVALFSCTFYAGAQTDLPKIIPPSPTTAALFRFQDYPMDYSTGLPQISIPIYQVTSGSLSVPISISYHASGRRVYDQDGPVALGWSLNAGGVVSRTAYGSPDFGNVTNGTYKFPYPFTVDNLSCTDDLTYLEKIMHYTTNDQNGGNINVMPWLDAEYDVFSYSVNNISGKFIFKDDNNVKTPVLLPSKPYKIIPTFTTTGITKIEITDDKGILYEFIPGDLYAVGYNSTTSSWVLSKITSADKTDIISFVYSAVSEERTTISQSATLIDTWTMLQEPFPSVNPMYSENTSHEPYQVARLTEIDFNQGKILFNLINTGGGGDKIENIQVVNLNNEIIKTIKFSRSLCYSQSELGTATNKLDSLVFKDKMGSSMETYSFEYNPLISSDGQLNARYCDWWGYYNNSGQHDFVPYYTNLYYVGSGGPGTINVGNSSANRLPNLEPLKSGVLKKIIYPTGGSTEFFYENNKCTLNGVQGSPINGPGLRLYQIKSTDNNGSSNIKTYKYGVNESDYGSIDLLPDITSMASEITIGYISQDGFYPDRKGKYRQRTFNSSFIGELSLLADRPVVYTEVTEYNGTETNNIGKTVYKYDYSSWAASGMPVTDPVTIAKKHIYNYNYFNNPSLILKTDFKKIDNSGTISYQIRKESSNTYSTNTTSYVKGLHVQRVYSVPQGGWALSYYSEPFVTYELAGNPFGGLIDAYTFSPYQIPVGYKNLSGTSETIYNDDGTSISNSVSYEYNSNQLINKTTSVASDAALLITDIKYPSDYTGNAVLTKMVNANMLDYKVEEISSKNTSPAIPISSIRTNYYDWNTTTPARIAPQTIDAKKGTNAYETRVRYFGYDASGNPLSVSKENDLLSSYLWGYNNTYPVAEVKNAKSNEIFFNSFEEGTGWGIGITAYDNTKSNSGKFSGRIDKPTAGELYSVNINWLSVSLTAQTKFKYSGWVYSSGPSADIYLVMKRAGESGAYTYADHITTTTTGKWVLLEKDFNVPADVTQIGVRIDNNGGGTVWFDDVRIHPSNAFMTTYTYEPLVGMTSSTDLNNRTSYFDYDPYGRLKLIRDMNKNIIKTFQYQYQSTTP